MRSGCCRSSGRWKKKKKKRFNSSDGSAVGWGGSAVLSVNVLRSYVGQGQDDRRLRVWYFPMRLHLHGTDTRHECLSYCLFGEERCPSTSCPHVKKTPQNFFTLFHPMECNGEQNLSFLFVSGNRKIGREDRFTRFLTYQKKVGQRTEADR